MQFYESMSPIPVLRSHYCRNIIDLMCAGDDTSAIRFVEQAMAEEASLTQDSNHANVNVCHSCFKEWESMAPLLSIIPNKGQRMNMTMETYDIHLTNAAVCGKYLFLGTNMAIVYIVNRITRAIEGRHKCASQNDDVVSLAAHHIHGDNKLLVSVGLHSGLVVVFSHHEPTSPSSPAIDYTSPMLHKSPISSLVISDDGRYIYAGDEDGVVVMISCDVQKMSSEVIVQESHPVVQLSCYKDQFLLISTSLHSIIFNLETKSIQKLGTKPRKTQGPFGACFFTSSHSDTEIYAARPGFRLWKCSINGSVTITHMFKDSITAAPNTELISPIENMTKSTDNSFGPLHLLESSTLVTWDSHSLYFIDVSRHESSSVVSVCRNVGPILSVSVTGDEIFILRPGLQRRLIHLTRKPNTVQHKVAQPSDCIHDHELPPIVLADNLLSIQIKTTQEDMPVQSGDVTQQQPDTITKLKSFSSQFESKFQSGLSTMKDKFSGSGVEMKNVGLSMKQGFGSLFQKMKPSKDPDANVELSSPVDPKVQSSTIASSTTLPKGDPIYPVVEGVASEEIPAEEFGDESLVIRLAPKKSSESRQTQLAHSASSETHQNVDTKRHKDTMHLTEEVVEPEETTPFDEKISENLSPPQAEEQPVMESSKDLEESEEQREETIPDINSQGSDDGMSGREMLDRLNSLLEQPPDDTVDYWSQPDEIKDDDIASASVSSLPLDEQQSVSAVVTADKDLDASTIVEGDGSDCRSLTDNPPSSPGSYIDPFLRSYSVQDEMSETSGSEEEPDEEDIYTPFGVQTESHSVGQRSRVLSETFENKSGESTLSMSDEQSEAMVKEMWRCNDVTFTATSYALSESFIWATDKAQNIWYCRINELARSWKKLNVQGSQISVSPSGSLAWRVHKDKVYAGYCRMPPFTPTRMKWTEAAKQVTSAAVDENIAWYIRTNNDIWCQRNISRERPIVHGINIKCLHKLNKISTRNGVTWALGSDNRIYYYDTTQKDMNSREWRLLREANNISDIYLGCDESAWVLDTADILWYTSGVTVDNPCGKESWWQVAYSEPITHENRHKFVKLFVQKSFTFGPVSTGGHIAVNDSMAMVKLSSAGSSINISLTHLTVHKWDAVELQGFPSTAMWRSLSLAPNGMLWGIYHSGELMAIDLDAGQVREIKLPQVNRSLNAINVSACGSRVWLIMSDGQVYHSGLTSSTIHASIQWTMLDTLQFDGQPVQSLSSGDGAAWAVLKDGSIFMSVGINAPRSQLMNPAWISVDSSSGCPFKSVVTSDSNKLVWAVDTQQHVFVRTSLTDDLPIGRSWLLVPGVKVLSLAVRGNTVWALTDNDEVVMRCGITDSHPSGDYWRKIPGSLKHITGCIGGVVVGLNAAGQLLKHKMAIIGKVKAIDELEGQTDGDWELV